MPAVSVVFFKVKEALQALQALQGVVHSLSQLLARLLAQVLNVFVCPPRAHGPNIVRSKVRIYGADGGAVARDNQGATALSTRQTGAGGNGLVDNRLILIRGGCGNGRVGPLDGVNMAGRANRMTIVVVGHGA
jgi:hypothetical protein